MYSKARLELKIQMVTILVAQSSIGTCHHNMHLGDLGNSYTVYNIQGPFLYIRWTIIPVYTK